MFATKVHIHFTEHVFRKKLNIENDYVSSFCVGQACSPDSVFSVGMPFPRLSSEIHCVIMI